MRTRLSVNFGSLLAVAAIVLTGCGGHSSPPEVPPAPTTFTISSVSPTSVDEGEAITVNYTGPDPTGSGGILATFRQGTLPSRQGTNLGWKSLGNNMYAATFQVPNGLASDAGLIPVPSTVTISNSQAASEAQSIQVAPPPSLEIFPEELHVGDSNVSVRLHGNNAHFDQTTQVSASGGIQVSTTTLVGGLDLVVGLTVTSGAAGSAVLTVASGSAAANNQEVISTPVPIANHSSKLIGASQISTGDGAPGAIVQVEGLFQIPDSVHHNIVEWVVGGHSVNLLPISETSSTLEVMVPLWPNPDGSIYAGPAQLKVLTSGNTNEFGFTVDALPSNSLARGTVFSAILNSLSASVGPLQNDLTAVYSSTQTLAAFQATTNGAANIIGQLQQFVSSEAAGVATVAPGGTQAIPTAQFDLVERLLVASGLYQQVTSEAKPSGFAQPRSSSSTPSVGEVAMVAAAALCRSGNEISGIFQTIQQDLYLAAAGAAVLGLFTDGTALGAAALLVEAGDLMGAVALVPDVISTACATFPVAMSQIQITPGKISLSTGGPSSQGVSVTGSFSICGNPTAALSMILDELLSDKLEKEFAWLPDTSLLQTIINNLADMIAGKTIDLVDQLLGPLMNGWLGVVVDSSPVVIVELSPATTSLFSDNFGVAVVSTNAFSVFASGLGDTAIHAYPHSFDFILTSGGLCHATSNPLDLVDNESQVSVTGSPINASTNSGGSTGIIPGTLDGNPIDEAYIAVPGSALVSVVDADAQAGAPPLTTIGMPTNIPGFSPTATAANPVTSEVYVISYASPAVVRINAITQSVTGMLTLPVTDTVGFSGGNCMVCGVVVDPLANQVIFDTADGYFIFDVGTNAITQSFQVHAAENFGYNAFTRQVLSPYYGAPFSSTVFGLDLLDLTASSSVAFSGSVGPKPDSAAVDYTTNVGVVANEAESTPVGFLTFLNLASNNSASGSFTAPTSSYQFPDASSYCSGGGDSSEWTMLAVDSSDHLLFIANEFSNCAGILDLPPMQSQGAPRAASQFVFGPMPVSPDGQPWANSLDPHGTAVFVSVIDGRSYGFLLRQDGQFVARIDLQKMFSAPVLAGTPAVIDMSQLVEYLPTLPSGAGAGVRKSGTRH